jgi:S-adenosylmethionine hydrolase
LETTIRNEDLKMNIITLLSDFGSFYPAQMKGVILSRIRDVTLVDISHDLPFQDITAGAFVLMSTVQYFPPGTVHLAVVDPGVGTKRLGIAVESGGHFLVGPDNGLLIPAARSLGSPRAFEISCHFDRVSNTFHGRDVFAPAAAMLAAGHQISDLGPEVSAVDLDFGGPVHSERGIEARIIYVDRFGNLITNMKSLPEGDLCLNGRRLRRQRTYAEAGGIEPLITIGSHGFAEIAVNLGNASLAFGLKSGDRISLGEI